MLYCVASGIPPRAAEQGGSGGGHPQESPGAAKDTTWCAWGRSLATAAARAGYVDHKTALMAHCRCVLQFGTLEPWHEGLPP